MNVSHFLPLLSGYNSGFNQQMALFGAQPAVPQSPLGANASDDTSFSEALLERISGSRLLTKSDKSGLAQLIATVEEFGKGNQVELIEKIAALVGMMEMMNAQKGVEGENTSLSLISKYVSSYSGTFERNAYYISPETQLKAFLAGLRA